MLVLSRKEEETFVFPALDISVKILRVQGKKVSIGITAPSSVKVLRSEIREQASESQLFNAIAAAIDQTKLNGSPEERHELRNQLQTLQLTLSVLEAQLKLGRTQEAEETLRKAIQGLQSLNSKQQQSEQRQAQLHDNLLPEKTKRKALVVEDNAQERALLAEYLRLNGYEVQEAENGCQALEYLANDHRPDVVLLDMNMPEMNGISTARAIRYDFRYRGIKLFVISGSPREDNYQEDDGAFYDEWFSKPIKPNDFILRLESELSAEAA